MFLAAFLLSSPHVHGLGPDPFVKVNASDKALLVPAIQRFSKDEIRRDWADLWEIDEQDIATKRDFLLKDDAPPVSRKEYIERKNFAIEGGGVPLMNSFELVSVVSKSDGFIVSACSASQRESFRFKGIVDVEAHIRNGKVTFGSWSYKYLMPHSCSVTKDSE
jgi:hypothetical protein